MDSITLRLIFVIGVIALAGLAILAARLIASLGARWRPYREPAGRVAPTAWGTVEEDDARQRALEFRQMLWRSLL